MFRLSFRQRTSQVIVFGLLSIGITLVAVAATLDRPNALMEVVAEDFVFRGNNPTLYAEPGAKVNLLFRNEARGIEHHLAIEGLNVETDILRPGEREEVSFFVPMRDTVLTYSCYLHPIMKGKFVVGSPENGGQDDQSVDAGLSESDL